MFTARARRLLRCTGSRHSAGQGKAWQQGVGSGAATRQLQQYLSDPAAPAAFAKLIANPPLPCADYLALTKAQDHSWRFFSQSSKYLCATARSCSLAWASALVYMLVIHASSGLAASLATMSQNNPSAAWRETSSPLNSMPPSNACAR